MDYVFNGLPVHILIVHLVVVLVPATALAVLAAAVWPAARRWLGVVPPVFALALVILVPITTNAGAWLQARVGDAPLIAVHASLGNTLLPWVIALAVVAVLQWAWFRLLAPRTAPDARLLRRLIWAACVVAVLVTAVGATVVVVQIGESGARALWDGSFSEQPLR